MIIFQRTTLVLLIVCHKSFTQAKIKNVSYDGLCMLDKTVIECNNATSKTVPNPSQTGLCQKCRSITELRMENGSLEIVKKGDLKHYPLMTRFSARNNEITEIFDRIFSKNKRLEKADLSNNKIEKLDSIAFYGSPQLHHLDLSKNRISRIPIYLFERLWNLRNLNLQHNLLSVLFLESFTGLIHLEILDLSNNVIIYIDKNAFSGLENLKHLDISRNKLKTFPGEIISNLPVLKFLNISHNKIEDWKSLDSKAPFNQTEEFYFEGQPMIRSQPMLNETIPVRNSTMGSEEIENISPTRNESDIEASTFQMTTSLRRIDLQGDGDVRTIIITTTDRLSPMNLTLGALAIAMSLLILYLSWHLRKRRAPADGENFANKEFVI